ncbi:hypothetical protein QEH56_16585 [Pelagicoccus enzymogenes]|uniref:hypothetical protein n=1 Tax=Pelagicoccus enzymogenes TaxID=2773457 RepID=UPI00280E7177|nr:hypothetical protein [Pelagicoccus enzymogenes]MDQ8199781.1 hypothetical protein [Pelagicoccus enzymogenes]
MNWKFKPATQNSIAHLPSAISYALYYQVQRRFGALRNPTPTSRLKAGYETRKRIMAQGLPIEGMTFVETGTGRMPMTPLAFWLMGADKTITIDLNPYVKRELIADGLGYFINNILTIKSLFNKKNSKADFTI